jgi:ribonuclease VapC
MILDTSALIAILRDEPEAAEFENLLESSPTNKISAANYVEVACVIDSIRDPVVSRRLDDLLTEAMCSIQPVTEHQARLARQAYRDYGKGSGHPAQLNFGDCFAYALAKACREPLLFKGNDFVHTDVERARP